MLESQEDQRRSRRLFRLQGRKITALVLAWLRIGGFDPIAEASELPDHSRSAPLLRSFGHGRAAFLVTDSLVQDHPDQPTLSMGNRSDGLIVSQARYRSGDRQSRRYFLWP